MTRENVKKNKNFLCSTCRIWSFSRDTTLM